jgi:DNA repair protein RecN (Recombination protein N)
MLKTLYIKNYALIEEIEIAFSSGLNIVTGETGAGKSILLGALGLLLGERASTDLVRQNAPKAVVEGLFSASDNESARRLLREQGYENGDEIVVRREISSRGTSRAFINDSPAPVSLVKELGDLLVDLHGQHDHQLLLRPETHIHLLDDAGGLERLVAEFARRYNEMLDIERRLHDLREREVQLRDRQEFHVYQLREIAAVNPQAGEDVAIGQELKILENSERLYELTTSLGAILYSDDNAVRDQLLRARNVLDSLVAIDPGFNEYRSECISAISIIEEITKYTQSYSVRFDLSFDRLEALRERLLAISGLRKRFGGTLDAVLEYRARITEEIALVENFDQQITSLESELSRLRAAAGETAGKLSRKRHEVARKVQRSVENVLKGLGIEHGRFVVEIDQHSAEAGADGSVVHFEEHYAAGPTGYDRAEFHISTNLGEDPKPLARVASGGEISRTMLALKTILAKNDKLPLLVFDEIDTGISGRIATKVGAAMRDLANYHQVIAITHLPQIAAMSNNHFVVEKSEVQGRTVTSVRQLNPEEHTREVAKLMSGETVTESSLKMARELIES